MAAAAAAAAAARTDAPAIIGPRVDAHAGCGLHPSEHQGDQTGRGRDQFVAEERQPALQPPIVGGRGLTGETAFDMLLGGGGAGKRSWSPAHVERDGYAPSWASPVEHLPEPEVRPMEPHLGRRLGDPKRPGHVVVAPPVDVLEHHHRPHPNGERADGISQGLA